jgi:DNA-binding response OmpR family regulator
MKYTILIVSDDEVRAKRLSDEIEKKNYNVIVAPDEKQAMFAFKLFKFDLVIIDIKASGLNGVNVTEFISSRFPSTNVIQINCCTGIINAVGLKNAGMDGLYEKPCDIEELLSLIGKVCLN